MDFRVIQENLPLMWEGFQMTIELFVITSVVALLLAVVVSILLVSKKSAVRVPVAWIVRFLRGTPLLVQLFIVYYGLSQLDVVRESWVWDILRKPYWCALIGLVLNSTAYSAHILRGAILVVPAAQIEAGRAFGMSSYKIYRCIVLPVAFRLALPSLGNEFIKNMKRTAIASTITINELTGVSSLIVSRTLAPFEIFAVAAMFYLAMTFVITRLVNWVENVFQVGSGSHVPKSRGAKMSRLEVP